MKSRRCRDKGIRGGSGQAVAGEFSANGDVATDLAVVGGDGNIHLFAGPIEPGTWDVDAADLVIETPWVEWYAGSPMVFADADGNGTIELIISDRYHGSTEANRTGPGIIAVYDLSAW